MTETKNKKLMNIFMFATALVVLALFATFIINTKTSIEEIDSNALNRACTTPSFNPDSTKMPTYGALVDVPEEGFIKKVEVGKNTGYFEVCNSIVDNADETEGYSFMYETVDGKREVVTVPEIHVNFKLAPESSNQYGVTVTENKLSPSDKAMNVNLISERYTVEISKEMYNKLVK